MKIIIEVEVPDWFDVHEQSWEVQQVAQQWVNENYADEDWGGSEDGEALDYVGYHDSLRPSAPLEDVIDPQGRV